MSAVSTATSVPVPMAMPTSAWASAGASLTPSPTMATLRPWAWSSLILAALSAGRTSAITASIPTCAAIRRAVFWLSPESMTARAPSSRSARTAAAAVSRGASAIAMSPASSSSSATSTTVRPSPVSSAARAPSPSTEAPARSIRRWLPIATRWPSTSGEDAVAGDRLEGLRGGQREPALGRRVDDRRGERMLGLPLDGRDGCEQLVLAATAGHGQSDDFGLAAGQRARLVEYDRVDLGGMLEGDRMLEQDPALGAEARADHDRGRGRESERVRAGDHDDRDREQQRLLDLAADDHAPDEKGDAAPPISATSTSQKAARSASRWPGRLRVLGLLDERHDLRERGVGSDRGRAGAQRAVLVDRRADHPVAGTPWARAGSRP